MKTFLNPPQVRRPAGPGAPRKPPVVLNILQVWVTLLGPRQQGALLSAVRGADDVHASDPSKEITRAFRGAILNTAESDPDHCSGFVQLLGEAEFQRASHAFLQNLGFYRTHYVVHLLQAAQIVGHHHPSLETQTRWRELYGRMCRKMHFPCETFEAYETRMNRPFLAGEEA